MNQYEVTFIVDPVLSGDEIVGTAQTYVDHLQGEGAKIVHVEEMGLRQLAYPLNKRTTGVYFCIEFTSETGAIIEKLELAFRRDERIMRFLTVNLDKFGVKYNDDKRKGLIGKKRSEKEPTSTDETPAPKAREEKPAPAAATKAPVKEKEAVAVTEAPVAATKAPEKEKEAVAVAEAPVAEKAPVKEEAAAVVEAPVAEKPAAAEEE